MSGMRAKADLRARQVVGSTRGFPGRHERAKKLAARKLGDPHPFVDPATWDARAKRQLELAKKVLAEEQAKAGATKAN